MRRAVLEDADKLHAEGLVFKLYNSEFKMDVFFPAPEPYKNVPQDLVEAYLQTEVGVCVGGGGLGGWGGGGEWGSVDG